MTNAKRSSLIAEWYIVFPLVFSVEFFIQRPENESVKWVYRIRMHEIVGKDTFETIKISGII